MSQPQNVSPVFESWRVSDAPESISSGGSLIPAAMHTIEGPEESNEDSTDVEEKIFEGLTVGQERHLKRMRRFGLDGALA